MCNVYLWYDYFIWLVVHLNFIWATIHIRLACNRHQDDCYYKAATATFDAFVVAFRNFFDSFVSYETVLHTKVLLLFCKCGSFASILYFLCISFVLPAPSRFFRCQLVFKRSQFPRY